MTTIRYEADDAIFYFDLQNVERILKDLISKHNVPEAAKLLEIISSHPRRLECHPYQIHLFPVHHSGSTQRSKRVSSL